MKNKMTIQELAKRIDDLAVTISKLDEALFPPEKGGVGSGCHGDNCGRPIVSDNDAKPTTGPASDKPQRPRAGVRPSAANPNHVQIEYREEPSSDGRPRSGVRPPKKSIDSLDEEMLKAAEEFMEQYAGLMQDLAQLEAAEKIHRHRGETMQACVSRGIATLINEGMSQEQASAAAYSMCGEKSGKCTCEQEG